MAEISIIVPVYNVSALLAPCIESVLSQTFTDWELLLVNDASTDNSLEICNRYADNNTRIRVVSLPKNSGVSAARNYGIDQTTAPFITFLDGDDRLDPRFLERLYPLVKSGSCEIASATFVRVKPEESPTCASNATIQFFSPHQAIEAALYQTGLDPSAWGKIYKRELFANVRFYPYRFEDLDIFYRLFLQTERIAWIPEPLYLYTINPASYLQNFNPGRAVVLDVTERLVKFMEDNHPDLLPAAHDRALSAAFNIFVLLKKHRCNEPQIESRCRTIIRSYRRQSLFNPKVRLKNKLAILATYIGGFHLITLAATLFTLQNH